MSKHVPRNRVADPLRALAETMRTGYDDPDCLMDERVAFEWYRRMRVVADHVDAEHDRRMEDQRQSYRRVIDG